MAILRRIFVIHTTVDKESEERASTDAVFQIQVVSSGPDFIKEFPNLDHDEREQDRTDEYEFELDVEEPNRIDTDDESFSIIMRMITGEKDADWLPKRIWALGETLNGAIILLGAHPEWEGGWFDFSEDDPKGPKEHIISGGPIA